MGISHIAMPHLPIVDESAWLSRDDILLNARLWMRSLGGRGVPRGIANLA